MFEFETLLGEQLIENNEQHIFIVRDKGLIYNL